MRMENREIALEFNPKTLQGLIRVKGSPETYRLDIGRQAWVRVADASGDWQRRGQKLDQLAKIPLTPRVCRRAVAGPNRLVLTFDVDGLEIVGSLDLRDDGFLDWQLYPTSGNQHAVVQAVFPGPLALTGQAAYDVVFPRAQGLLFKPGREAYDYEAHAGGQSLTMRWFGGLGRHSAYLCIADQPEDATYTLHYAPRADFKTGFCWDPSFGSLRYLRRLRYRFIAEPSYVRLALIFRQYAERKGLVVSLRDKMAACPALDRLWGGVLLMLGYFNDPRAAYLSNLRKIQALGITRGLIYPVRMDGVFTSRNLAPFVRLPDRLIKTIRQMGYLTGVFFCPCDIAASHPLAPVLASRRNPAKPDELSPSWQINANVYYRTHFGKILERFDRLFDLSDLDNVHFDVLGNAAGSVEDYSPDWPQTRSDHLAAARAMARYFLARGHVVSSEGKSDSLAPDLHWGSFRMRVVPQYRRNDQMPPHLHPVPLWQLVFHDVMFHSAWEHHTYNDGCGNGAGDPVVGYLHDLLYGDLPSVFAMGRIYRYVQGKQVEFYSSRFADPVVQRALALAKKAADHHRQIGLCRMVAHRFLDDRFLVQETVFDNGQRVLVNFADRRADLDESRLPARTAVVR